MAIKESSDELNPTVPVAAAEVPAPKPFRSLMDYLALGVATCGVGYMPIAPGTFGSLVGIGLYLLIGWTTAQLIWPAFIAISLAVVTAVILLGIWAGSRAERLLGKKDPGKVVVDEVAGQLIALLPVLPRLDRSWFSILVAFFFFRLFDIVKPYPARKLEALPSGLGIMSDDVIAGAYAALATSIVIAVAL